jgi:hypothetical protein
MVSWMRRCLWNTQKVMKLHIKTTTYNLNKDIYRLKKAPRAWDGRMDEYLHKMASRKVQINRHSIWYVGVRMNR